MSSNISVCDRCSAEIDADNETVNDGPEGSEWEGCSLCDVCLGQVEEEPAPGDEDANQAE